jgi:hypothetical protein
MITQFQAHHNMHPTAMKLPKYLHLTLRYLQEVIRAGKVSQYSGSSTALLDSILQYIANELKVSGNNLKLEELTVCFMHLRHKTNV